MADTDGGGVLVQVGVSLSRLERDLNAVVKQMQKSAKQGEDAFTQANDNVAKGAQKAFGALGKGASAAAPAVKNVGGYTANLASQLNDISVQLAGGQSPFQIMLQQGTQIGQIAQQAGGGLRGLGSLLVGAFTQVLNPVNLLTFAVIGLGGAALQYFGSVVSGGEESNKVVQEHEKLIESVAKTWGDAVPALKAYVDQLERSKDVADVIQAGNLVGDKQFDVARKQVTDLSGEIGALVVDLQQAGAENETILALQDAFDRVSKAVKQGRTDTEAMKDVQTALADALNQTGLPAVSAFTETFNKLSAAISSAADEAKKFREQSISAVAGGANVQDIVSGATFRDNDGTIRRTVDFIPGETPTPDKRPSTESMFPGDTWTKPKGSTRGANAYKDEVASIKERTAALQASTAAQAAINPLVKDYGYAAAKAAAEQKLLADAERSKMDITPQLRESISNLAGAYADATVEAKKLSESQDEIRKRAEEWANLEKDVFGGFIKDLTQGKSAADSLADALQKIGNKLLDMAFDDAFSAKSGGAGGGTGFFSSILGSIGKIFGFASGTANTGGRRGQPVGIVHGEEAVIPLPAGGKVPVTISSPKTSDMAGSRVGDTHVSIPINIDATGADAAGLSRVEKQLADLKRSLPGTIITTVKDGQRRRLVQ